MKNLILASLLALFFGIVACEKNISDPSENTTVSPHFIVKDGRLVFKDSKTMHQFAIGIINNDARMTEELIQAKGFTSLEKSYSAIDFDYYSERPVDEVLDKYSNVVTLVREGKEAYVMRNVTEEIEAQLVNELGILQVGDSIVKVTREVTFIFHERYIDKINNVEQIPGCRKILSNTTTQEAVFESNLRGVQENCEDYYNSNKQKLKGRAGSRESFVSGAINLFCESTHYKRGALGIWFGQDTNNLSCGASGSVTFIEGNTSITRSFTIATRTFSGRSNLLSETGTIAFDPVGDSSSQINIDFSMNSDHSCNKVGESGTVGCSIFVAD